MSGLSIVVLGIATNLDNMVVGMAVRASGQRMPLWMHACIAWVSGVCAFGCCMLAEWLGGWSGISGWLGGGCLIALGAYTWCTAQSTTEGGEKPMTIRGVWTLSVMLAINCAPAAFAAGMLGISPGGVAAGIGIGSLLFVALGASIGARLAHRIQGKGLARVSAALMGILGVIGILF